MEPATEMRTSQTCDSLNLNSALVITERLAFGALNVTQATIGSFSGADTRENGGSGVLIDLMCVNSKCVQMVTTILMTSTFATKTLDLALSSKRVDLQCRSVQVICLMSVALEFALQTNQSVTILSKKWLIQLKNFSSTSLQLTSWAQFSPDQPLQKHLRLHIVSKIEQFLI